MHVLSIKPVTLFFLKHIVQVLHERSKNDVATKIGH